MSGSGYDISAATYSPEGRVFQIEYASKAVMDASYGLLGLVFVERKTCVGIQCKDGIVMGIEKVLTSPFLVDGSNKHIHIINDHIGCLIGGYTADGRYFAEMTRQHADEFKSTYGESITPKVLSDNMGGFAHQFTCHGYLRPLGVNAMIAGYDHRKKTCELYTITTSGLSTKHFADALGKGRQSCKATIDKQNLTQCTCQEVLQWVTYMYDIKLTDDNKPYEIELGLLCEENQYKFERLSAAQRDELVRQAKEKIEREEQESSSSDSE